MTAPGRPPLPTREIPAVWDVSTPWSSITVSPGLLESAGPLVEGAIHAHRYAIIADDTVARLYGDAVLASFTGHATLFTFPAGEASKSREQWSRLTDLLLGAGFGRDSAIVALGGGVTGDLAGFVAATYMRGIPYAQLPTSLLAMVDSSVGGKTAIDVPGGKNLVGAFHQPATVIIDPDLLRTLPAQHVRAGLAEMLKHGVIADAYYFDRVVEVGEEITELTHRLHPGSITALAGLVARSIEIKRDIVSRDERESGPRKTLNFGHTVAHALETVSHFEMLHGEAVGIGMLVEARIAERMRVCEPGLSARILDALGRLGLPWEVPAQLPRYALLAAMRSDKKAREGVVEFALPVSLGSMIGADRNWAIAVDESVVREALG